MEKQITFEDAMKYRENLVTYGKKVVQENPDKLGIDEIQALTVSIFDRLNGIDMSLGREYYDTGLKLPAGVSKQRQQELFLNFIDWYRIINTPNSRVYDYVINNYPKDKYPRVLCVGDGENCHLGRNLAMEGYQVVSVDPVARREFTGKSGTKGGSFKAVQAEFYNCSTDMIDWASIVVGSKIPQCAEQLIGLKKPSVFNISKNAEIHKMRFKGIPIKSSEQLTREIAKCSGVSVKRIKDTYDEHILFVCDSRLREDR